MWVRATIVIAMASAIVSLEASAIVSLEASSCPFSSPQAPFPLAHVSPPSPTIRRRSLAAAALRRARAVSFGFYRPKPPAPNKAYIEVPKTLKPQIQDMVRGKVLKSIREEQVGTPATPPDLRPLPHSKATTPPKNNSAPTTS